MSSTAVFSAAPDSFDALFATLTVLVACTVLGASIGPPRGRLAGADTMVGVGLAGGALSLLAGMTMVPVSTWAIGLGILASAAAGRLVWRRIVPGGAGFWLVLLLLVPFLLIAAAAPATMWDDFWHWLPNAAYMYRFDSLAHLGMPDPLARWPGYPQTMPLLTVTASWLAGRFLESAGQIANLIILGTFAAVLVGAVAELHPSLKCLPLASKAGTIGVVLTTIIFLNPGFDKNVTLSTYADVGTTVAVATCGLLALLILERSVEGRFEDARSLAWRFGFVAVALVNLKQSNPVLLALLAAGFALVVWRDSQLKASAIIQLLPAMLLPSLIIHVMWRIYVHLNFPSGEMGFKSLPEWNFAVLPDTLNSIHWIYRTEPTYYVLMYSITGLGLAAVRSPRNSADRLLVVTAVGWIGYNLFLLLIYLGAMTDDEASYAADYGRYTTHLGLLGISAIALRIATVWGLRQMGKSLQAISVASLLVFPIVTVLMANRLTPLAKDWPMYFRSVGRDLADILPENSRIVVLTGDQQNPMKAAIKYDLWRPGRNDRNLRLLWEEEMPETVFRAFEEGQATYLLITGALKPMNIITEALDLPQIGRETILFAWNKGSWKSQLSWPIHEVPASTP